MRLLGAGRAAVAALLALAMASAGGAVAQAKPSAHTAIVYVNPVAGSTHLLKSGYTIVRKVHVESSCEDSELVVGAARCFAGHVVYDPCWNFRRPDSDYSGLACLASPFSKSVTWLAGTQVGNGQTLTKGHTLWGVRLAHNVTCVELSGAVDSYRGHFYQFACSDGRALIDSLDRSRAVWRARAVTHRHGKYTVGMVSVAGVYYGYGQQGR